MKPTTDEVLAWAKEAGFDLEIWPVLTEKSYSQTGGLFIGLEPKFSAAIALAYKAGAAAMKERCVDAVPPQYFELRDRIRALGDDDD